MEALALVFAELEAGPTSGGGGAGESDGDSSSPSTGLGQADGARLVAALGSSERGMRALKHRLAAGRETRGRVLNRENEWLVELRASVRANERERAAGRAAGSGACE